MADGIITNDEVKLASENWRAYERARDNGHLDYVDRARKYNDYYLGDQWDKTVKAELEAVGRPALTINEILPKINTVMGEQTTRRVDFVYKPAKDGKQETADAMTKLALNVTNANKLEWVESQVFGDGLIQDRGYYDVRMDFTNNIQGDLAIISEDPLNILLDPDAKEYDPKTWKSVIKTKWFSVDDIKLLYGEEHAAKLRYLAYSGPTYGPDSAEVRGDTFGGGEGDVKSILQDGTFSEDEENAIRRVRVIERQHRRLNMRKHFVDPATGETKAVPDDWKTEKVQEFARQLGLEVIKRLESRIRWTVTADTAVCHDAWSPYRTFTIIPYFPFFRRGRPIGLVKNLISPQDSLNKLCSQELHVVNTTANSGWKVQTGSLSTLTPDELERHGAKTGLVLEYNRGFDAPEKIEPNQIPTGLDRLSSKAELHMKSISGVNDAMLGTEKSEVSGVAINAKRAQGMVQFEVPLDNLRFSRQMLGEKCMEIFQDFYTESRVFQIIDYKDPERKPEDVAINQPTPAGEIINDFTLGEYSLVLSVTPSRDTFDDNQFAEAIGLREIGVQIPDDVIVEYSHLSKKAELAERIRQAMGIGKLTPEQQQQQQIEQEIQMRSIIAEISAIEGKAASLMSQAELNKTKALEIMGTDPNAPPGEQGPTTAELRLEYDKIDADIGKQREKLESDRRNLLDQLNVQMAIARMNDSTKRSVAQTQSFDKRVQSETSLQESRESNAAAKEMTAHKNDTSMKVAMGKNKTATAVAKARAKAKPMPKKKGK